MNYTKPEITSLASATFVIQGTTLPKASNYTDSLSMEFGTPTAYEADE